MMIWDRISFETRLFLTKCCLYTCSLCLASSISTGVLFCIIHYLRNFEGSNLRLADLCFSLALIFAAVVLYLGSKYLTKNQTFKSLIVIIILLATSSTFTILGTKVLWILGVKRFWRILEYCGDWLLWGLLAYIAWYLIFCNPDFDEDFKKFDDSRKRK